MIVVVTKGNQPPARERNAYVSGESRSRAACNGTGQIVIVEIVLLNELFIRVSLLGLRPVIYNDDLQPLDSLPCNGFQAGS